ncbi:MULTISPECIES: rhodanese-like domain-containing protein [unclassified Polaromonas]|jgi:rhodanese-related sulfurtransferase|uniref:rhodanese-like domain-containing protein n=1 Tax=unclassified Polaromonas TaxID=2638319 RepID=UPI000F07F00B|nr:MULTISPECIES: rhodanese-like domain-containing protein [unclassified Polaromonas]AYQ26689.1 sulfurtransferase [Polaromonas sp. SP1]QGJ18466.1 sulfurtransferase [Polaromonas sp. Pch-P]
MIAQLSPIDFAAWRDNAGAGADALPVVLDVREPWELQTASVKEDGFKLVHIPMREIPARLAELQEASAGQPIACLCHHGMRSLQVANYLIQSGEFPEVVNLHGGIDAWSQQVDRSVPLY